MFSHGKDGVRLAHFIDVAIKFANYFGVSLDALCDAKQTGSQFKSYGDIARTLHALLKTGRFRLVVRDVIDLDMGEDVAVAEIAPSDCWREDGAFSSSSLNDFLVRYNKMAKLLYENTLSQEIFDTWIESEFLKLDRWLREAADNANET